LAGSQTLTDLICRAPLSEAHWRTIGVTVAAFHRHGVHHADLNAQNILIADAAEANPVSRVHLLDFDRGRLRPRGSWEEQVLTRLRRSLDKVRRQHPGAHFGEQQWEWLIEGYRSGSAP
jgi:3-deoxy-D-manno-octulosonic acid kinase